MATPKPLSPWRPQIVRAPVWRGSWTEIRELRRNFVTKALPLREALRLISQLVPAVRCNALAVPTVKVYEGEYVKGSRREDQNIIEVFTNSDFQLRARFKGCRTQIHQQTGWFVVPRGEYLASGRTARLSDLNFSDPDYAADALTGNLQQIEKVSAVGGQAFRVRLSCGSNILLDLGSPGDFPFETGDRLILLSHTHSDHTGDHPDRDMMHPGTVRQAMMRREIPIVASHAACRLLHAQYGDRLDAAACASLYAIQPGAQFSSPSGLRIQCYAIPHTIGSLAWSITDGHNSVFYTGDLLIRSDIFNKLDWSRALIDQIQQLPGNKLVILDAARAHVDPDLPAQRPWSNITDYHEDIVLLMHDVDRLIFAYVNLYFEYYRRDDAHEPCFIMTGAAREIWKYVFKDLLGAGHHNPESYLLNPRNRWGAAESKALYWLDSLSNISDAPKKRFWFIDKVETLEKLHHQGVFRDRGLFLNLDGARVRFAFGMDWTVIPPSQADWALHSRPSDLAEFLKELNQLDPTPNVRLFHVRNINEQKVRHNVGLNFGFIGEEPLIFSK